MINWQRGNCVFVFSLVGFMDPIFLVSFNLVGLVNNCGISLSSLIADNGFCARKHRSFILR